MEKGISFNGNMVKIELRANSVVQLRSRWPFVVISLFQRNQCSSSKRTASLRLR